MHAQTLLTMLCGGLSVGIASAATPGMSTGVAIGSIGRGSMTASAQYVLRSTVFEQLRSRGVPTLDADKAPYVYLARVGIDKTEAGCIYHVTANLLPNPAFQNVADGKQITLQPLWTREFSSTALDCDQVNEAMTRTLDRFAGEFSRDSADGELRRTPAASAQK